MSISSQAAVLATLDEDSKPIAPSRRVLLELCPHMYAFGNTKAQNLLPELPDGEAKVRQLLPMYSIPDHTSL